MDLRRKNGLVVMVGWSVAVFVLSQLCCLCSANVVFKVEHKFGGGRSRSLQELRAHDAKRHCRMLAAVDMPLGGNARPSGAALYYTKLSLGTPSKDFQLQVDTGSDIMWVNCAGCDNCPTKTNLNIDLMKYDPRASSTSKHVTCDQEFCSASFDGQYANCRPGEPCQYAITYGDKSQTQGFFMTDTVTLNRVSGNLQTTAMNGTISFGCAANQKGDLDSSQAVDGIVGFGQQNSSLIQQLASSGKVKRIFSHCLSGSAGGGIFAIGEVVQPKFSTTPLVKNQPHYNVNLKAVEVGGNVLDFPSDFFDTNDRRGTIIDSGTTLAYLPPDLYNALMEKVTAKAPQMHIVDNQFKCFQYSGNVDDGFPVVIFHFEDSLSLTVYPHDYLFSADDDWCIGWQDNGPNNDNSDILLLGDLALTNKLVVYDLENQTLGWTDYNCSSSIQVKDDETKNVYSVSAHDISSASGLETVKFLSLLLLTAILHLIC